MKRSYLLTNLHRVLKHVYSMKVCNILKNRSCITSKTDHVSLQKTDHVSYKNRSCIASKTDHVSYKKQIMYHIKTDHVSLQCVDFFKHLQYLFKSNSQRNGQILWEDYVQILEDIQSTDEFNDMYVLF